MRIAHVIHAFPPFSRAGAENYAESLASEQLRRHDVCVFHRVDEVDRPEYEVREALHGPLPVVRLNRTFRDLDGFEGTYRNDTVAAAFADFLDRYRPGVVHFHHVTCLSTTCVDVAAERGLPVVYTLHDFWLVCPRGQLVRRDGELSLCEQNETADCVACMAWQLRIRGGHARVKALARRARWLDRSMLSGRLLRAAVTYPWKGEGEARQQIETRQRHVLEMCNKVRLFLAPSRTVWQRYHEFGVRAERLRLSDYGFSMQAWRGAPGRRPDPRGRLRVAYLGTWIPPKGVHVLLEAFGRLDRARFVLHLHGHAVPYDGSDAYEEKIRRMASELPHVQVEGGYTPEDVPGLLARADVLAVPSIWYENSPLTIHEGFLAGLPVVASAQGGMQELVRHGVNGLTFEPRNPEALAATLRRLAEEEGLLTRLASARNVVKSIEENAAELEAIYCQLGAAARGR